MHVILGILSTTVHPYKDTTTTVTASLGINYCKLVVGYCLLSVSGVAFAVSGAAGAIAVIILGVVVAMVVVVCYKRRWNKLIISSHHNIYSTEL